LKLLLPSTRLLRRAAVFALLLAAALPLCAQQARFPEPEFEKPHPLPQTTQPSTRSLTMEYVDLAALVAALSLAAWLVLKARSRRAIFLLMVASLLYFGFRREGCVCAVGSIQNVALAIFSEGYAIPLTAAAIFLLPLLFALLFGRVFCAAVCPLGAAQDAVVLKPARVPPWLSRFLGTLPYVYLGLAVLAAATGADFLICRYDPFVGFFRMGATFEMLLLGGAFLLVGTIVARPYCRFLCPYGVLLKWMSSLSRRHLTITPSECTQCRLCENRCPFDLILKPSPAREAESRRAGVRRLGWLFALLPVLAAAGIGAGLLAHASLSRIHSTVRLAERVALEKSGKAPDTTVESRTFYETDKPADALFAQARAIRGRFRMGSILLGAFLGLVVGGRLIAFSVRRRSPDYRPDRADCFSCGRCIPYCPVEKKPESLGMPR
jgi:ferredoxin